MRATADSNDPDPITEIKVPLSWDSIDVEFVVKFVSRKTRKFIIGKDDNALLRCGILRGGFGMRYLKMPLGCVFGT